MKNECSLYRKVKTSDLHAVLWKPLWSRANLEKGLIYLESLEIIESEFLLVYSYDVYITGGISFLPSIGFSFYSNAMRSYVKFAASRNQSRVEIMSRRIVPRHHYFFTCSEWALNDPKIVDIR